ncbi:MAG: penicillin-binding protein 2 [Oscillospiraceae bacterium]|nr:penicillin-binding protein 2 [Oscillospiraceae bacterium]
MYKRITLLGAVMILGNAVLVANLAFYMKNSSYAETALHQSQITVTAGSAEGVIYDRNFKPFVNQELKYYAFVNPTQESISELLPHTREITPILKALQKKMPFTCEVNSSEFQSSDITVLELPERYSENPLAQHVLGYTLEHTGITGLESDYNQVLRNLEDTASVTYTVDATGHVLAGAEKIISPVENKNSGIVTTLDITIQEICESQELKKGAIVVMDIESGDILAMASFPDYTPDSLGEAIANSDSPLINRCLYAYNVGSIFKLMTCATAYTQNLKNFSAICTGSTEIKNQIFRCHDWNGHDLLNMKQAMIYSCNTYFVQLSQFLQPVLMRETAQNFGFGTQIVLSKSIVSSSGTLPKIKDLSLPAEMANFCFGQGLLTATPLQVTQMTCGIANDGKMPLARLVRGITDDKQTILEERSPMYARATKRNVAYYLQDMMISAVNENENSNAIPEHVFVAGKTSTAQTGRYDEENQEYCHAWITGYFPISKPKYAVTVLVEDGGYGNDAAAPIFRNIADAITLLDNPQIASQP